MMKNYEFTGRQDHDMVRRIRDHTLGIGIRDLGIRIDGKSQMDQDQIFGDHGSNKKKFWDQRMNVLGL